MKRRISIEAREVALWLQVGAFESGEVVWALSPALLRRELSVAQEQRIEEALELILNIARGVA
jgi:hypothetical protein